MKDVTSKVQQCLDHALDSKRILHDALTDTDYQTVKDLHKCFEHVVELEVRYQMILTRIQEEKDKS